jgi:NADH-quinone oxidoreductase subunit C
MSEKEVLKKEILAKVQDKFKDIAVLEEGARNQYYLLLKDSKDNKEVVRFLFKDLGARMNIITGIDARDYIELLYHMSFDKAGILITVKALAYKPLPAIDSITDIIVAAKWIEREIYELYNIKFKGHPELIPLLRSDTRPADYFPFRREVKDTHPTIRMKEKNIKEK